MKIKPLVVLNLWIILSMLFSAGPSGAKASEALPKAVVEQTLFEFSPVIAGEEISHVFKIENKGTGVLKIPGIYTE